MAPSHDPVPRSSTSLVRRGWNRASKIYRSDDGVRDAFGHPPEEFRRWLQPILERGQAGDAVLDLGCGCGVPAAAMLSERFQVLGVDLSDVQIERARQFVPGATFRRGDMTKARFRAGSFDAIVCLYALIHVPIQLQRPLLSRIARWLKPEGLLLLTTGAGEYEGIEEDWLGSGAPMFWSHADAATYRGWLERLGFVILREELVPEGTGGHELFLAESRRGPGTPRSGSV